MIKMAEKTTQHFEYWAAKAKETTKDVKEKEAATKGEMGGGQHERAQHEAFEKPDPAPLIGRSSLREASASDA